MKVWVVGQGEYSSYNVLGVVSSLARAEEIAVTYGNREYGDEVHIDEFELDAISRDMIEFYASVWFDTGEIANEPRPDWIDPEDQYYKADPIDERKGHRKIVWGWGPTPEAAIKAARDTRAGALAQQACL